MGRKLIVRYKIGLMVLSTCSGSVGQFVATSECGQLVVVRGREVGEEIELERREVRC